MSDGFMRLNAFPYPVLVPLAIPPDVPNGLMSTFEGNSDGNGIPSIIYNGSPPFKKLFDPES